MIFHILINLYLSGAVCTSRMAQYIGQKSISKSKAVLNLTLIILLMFGLLTTGLYALFRYKIAALFTNKKEIIELAASLTFIAGICHSGILYSIPCLMYVYCTV